MIFRNILRYTEAVELEEDYVKESKSICISLEEKHGSHCKFGRLWEVVWACMPVVQFVRWLWSSQGIFNRDFSKGEWKM